MYAASDGLSTVLIEEDVPGGQASHTSLIENFFGFVDGIGGAELARLAGRQAERFGAELILQRGVVGSSITAAGQERLALAGGYELTADVVLAATGMVWRRLPLAGVDELLERGVYYGAGRSEAAQCAGDDVVVIGAGNSAGQAVMNLAHAGARVTMAVRGERLDSTMSAYLVERVERHPLIDVRLRSQVTELHADGDRLAGVTLTDAGGATRAPRGSGAVHLHRRRAAHRLGRRDRRSDEGAGYIVTGADLLDAGQAASTAGSSTAIRSRSKPACRALRRRRRPLRLDQTGRRRGRRGGDGRGARPSPARGAGHGGRVAANPEAALRRSLGR